MSAGSQAPALLKYHQYLRRTLSSSEGGGTCMPCVHAQVCIIHHESTSIAQLLVPVKLKLQHLGPDHLAHAGTL